MRWPRYKDQGFSTVKLKSGFEVDENMASIAEVWEVNGPKMGLMLHANRGCDSVGGIRLAIAAEAFDIRWFEEPVSSEDSDGYLAVKSVTSIPMAGGETEYARFGFR